MKPHLLKVSMIPESSFNIREDRSAYFYDRWHFHPEIELVYIGEGCGTQFIGAHIARFQPGDMILVGSNLPHLWRCDPEYFEKGTKLQSLAMVVHFHPHSFGTHFFEVPEVKRLRSLLEESKQGIRIMGTARDTVKDLLLQLRDAKGVSRFIILLSLLDTIDKTKEKQLMNLIGHDVLPEQSEASRINSVFQHTVNHFQRKISLPEIAGVAHLSPKSFCRYFKANTRKTYYAFLLEVRVAHACKLLAENDCTIADICYESGFNNLSNFNRYFKKITKKTPVEYKREHKKLS